MKLIRPSDARPSDLPYIVKPFAAKSQVEWKLSNPASGLYLSYDHGPVRLSNGHSGRPEYTKDDVLKDVLDGRVLVVNDIEGFPSFPLFEFKNGQWCSNDSGVDFLLRYSLDYLNAQKFTPEDIKKGAASSNGASFASTKSVADDSEQVAESLKERKLSLPLGESAKVAPIAAVPASQAMASSRPEDVEPGFHVVRKPMSKVDLLTKLFGAAGNKPESFDRLNPDLGDQALPGEMIVLGDPDGQECTREEADLMSVASSVNEQVRSLSEDEAQFIVDYYDLLEALTSNTATGLSAGSVMISRQIDQINNTLRSLESLHQASFKKHGHLNSSEFFDERRKLFKRLDFSLGNVARKGLSLDDAPKLKQALGVSTKSLVHNWKQAGVGDIPGYATYYDRLATGAKYMRYTGYLAIGLDASVAAMRIKEACTAENPEKECKKVTYMETGRVAGGAFGGAIGGSSAVLCGVLGIATTPVGGVACVVIVGGAGSAAGGYAMSNAGESFGEVIYEATSDE
ncbi:hypothetical protein [Marinobacter bohaiensis]|uniref:hypothetical protein n=1 Tax=Marinobacter bohaiensis TaxID=2201898 RepID=UPI001D176C6A|nr:hypothetical protein [Marinobacter bohaiensis]